MGTECAWDGMLNVNLQKLGEAQAIVIFPCPILEDIR
jgi:hypothetical protein